MRKLHWATRVGVGVLSASFLLGALSAFGDRDWSSASMLAALAGLGLYGALRGLDPIDHRTRIRKTGRRAE
jgi:hypothetical protein